MKSIDVFEHGRLLIGEEGFNQSHWDSFVKLNTVHNGEYFQVLHNGLRFKQYVGVIQVDGLLVHIHPKADKDDSNDKWKDVLLQMLKACRKVNAQTAGNANLKKQNINLLEVYFEYFLKEVDQLIHAGLIKKYRTETSNVKALKGKLDFAGNIRHNLIHKERFYTAHQIYDVNHTLHQVLAHALDIVGQFTRATRLNDKCRRAQLAFPEVDRIKPSVQLLEGIKINRKTAPYERALQLAKLIILNYSPDINHGKQKMIALLFDMNVLWEEYVLRELKRYAQMYPEEEWEVTGQSSKVFYGSHRTIRPDIVLKKRGETIIIDTKWKRPTNKAASIEDLRQMYAYARFWDTEKVMLLYPGDPIDSQFLSYRNQEIDRKEHQCKVALVSVLEDNCLSKNLGRKVLKEIEQ
ncbi:MAG: restriction endonuclease [Crocinitomicaceae bacterium]|nr:restriction endonuclease [Crocinitomicaceae bacterium]